MNSHSIYQHPLRELPALGVSPLDAYVLLLFMEAGDGPPDTIIKQARISKLAIKQSYARLAAAGHIAAGHEAGEVTGLIPADWCPAKADLDWARQSGLHLVVDVPDETRKFVGWWRRKQRPVKRPSQAWRNWMRNQVRYKQDDLEKRANERKAAEASIGQVQVEFDL